MKATHCSIFSQGEKGYLEHGVHVMNKLFFNSILVDEMLDISDWLNYDTKIHAKEKLAYIHEFENLIP